MGATRTTRRERRSEVKSAFSVLVAWLFGAVFVWAGIVKLSGLDDFQSVLRTYQIFPESSLTWIAAVMPWFEILLGVGLMIPHWRQASAFGVLGLNIAFIVILLSLLFRGITVSCGCFGVELLPVGSWTLLLAILRDIVFVILAWWVASQKALRQPQWRLVFTPKPKES